MVAKLKFLMEATQFVYCFLGFLLTNPQVYRMTSIMYLFRPLLTHKAIYHKTVKAKLYI